MGKKSKCAQRRKAGRTLSNLSIPGGDSSPASCAQEEPANGVDGHAPALPIQTAEFEEYILGYSDYDVFLENDEGSRLYRCKKLF